MSVGTCVVHRMNGSQVRGHNQDPTLLATGYLVYFWMHSFTPHLLIGVKELQMCTTMSIFGSRPFLLLMFYRNVQVVIHHTFGLQDIETSSSTIEIYLKISFLV